MYFAPTTINPYNYPMKNQYLKEGKQTQITKNLKEISNSLEGRDLEYIGSALEWIKGNISKIPKNIVKNDVFRRRTADEIIKDSYASGCTDYALVFIALCRAKKIPAKYIEAIKCSWLKDSNSSTINGHIFAECFINDSWIQIDPQRGTIHIKKNYNGFEIYGEGLDSWDLGITDFDSLKKKFERYKKSYNKIR